jgi:hypothetical protein
MRSPFHSLLLLCLSLTLGSAVDAFVVAKYFPCVEVVEIIKELPQPGVPPCLRPANEGKG